MGGSPYVLTNGEMLDLMPKAGKFWPSKLKFEIVGIIFSLELCTSSTNPTAPANPHADGMAYAI